MELRDYIDIFKKQASFFWMIVIIIVLGAVVWQKNQPESYRATLLLNIGRGSVQDTEQYTYDSFYRLQADERFADTVVRWLGAPRVVEDIYGTEGSDPKLSGIRDLKNMFEAKRLSSQMIEVTYADMDAATLRKVAESVVGTLNRYTESLNKEDKESNWFVVIGSDPVIRDARISLSLALAVGLASGIFIGFWAALFRHYFRKQ